MKASTPLFSALLDSSSKPQLPLPEAESRLTRFFVIFFISLLLIQFPVSLSLSVCAENPTVRLLRYIVERYVLDPPSSAHFSHTSFALSSSTCITPILLFIFFCMFL